MISYILRRLALMIPTLFGIMLVSFTITQFVPGGPIERIIAQVQGQQGGAMSRITGGQGDLGGGQSRAAGDGGSTYRGAQGLSPDYIKKLEAQFGFDKPAPVRFWMMVRDYASFDFGKSFTRDVTIIDLIREKLPVSISLGVFMTLISYAISIPLGIRKAVNDGTPFDIWTSFLILFGFAIPGFLFGLLLIILFSGGSFLSIFPFGGLTSEGWSQFPLWQKILDYAWHLVLPLTALVVGAFATSTMLTKNSFLDEIHKQYALTARMKGNTERRVLYGHVFRNAMLLVISGFPGAFLGAFFTGSLLIENLFGLDGLGLLGLRSLQDRDYAVVLATLYIFSLVGLLVNLLSDLTYAWIDPRIDFSARAV